jgi:hypothetical protein
MGFCQELYLLDIDDFQALVDFVVKHDDTVDTESFVSGDEDDTDVEEEEDEEEVDIAAWLEAFIEGKTESIQSWSRDLVAHGILLGPCCFQVLYKTNGYGLCYGNSLEEGKKWIKFNERIDMEAKEGFMYVYIYDY